MLATEHVTEQVCSKGMSCYTYLDNDQPVVFVGLGNPTRRNLRPRIGRNREYLVEPGTIADWISRTMEVLRNVGVAPNEELVASVRAMHNVQPAVNIVVRAAEAMIRAAPGTDFNAKLAAATPSVRDLYYGAMLIPWMIEVQHNLVNPDSITYGPKGPRDVYRLVDRIGRSYRVLAQSEYKQIKLQGPCYTTVPGYESLTNLFVILIDNAVKYSLPNQTIVVDVTDVGNCVRVDVDSFGPIIKREETEAVFHSGYRGEYAKRFTNVGMGRGLYTAELIAKAHKTIIECLPGEATLFQDNMPCGTNRFRVRLYP